MDQNDMLHMRLDQNYRDYASRLQSKTADELIALAPEIAATQQLRDELACACSEEDAAILLQFEDPLEKMRGFWIEEQDGCHSEGIGHMIGGLHCRKRFPLPPAKTDIDKPKHTPSRAKWDNGR